MAALLSLKNLITIKINRVQYIQFNGRRIFLRTNYKDYILKITKPVSYKETITGFSSTSNVFL